MTKVIHPPKPAAGQTTKIGQILHHRVAVRIHKNSNLTHVQCQQAIENALTMALYFVRQPGRESANLWAATAKANRALTLLKQASQGITHCVAANDSGRA